MRVATASHTTNDIPARTAGVDKYALTFDILSEVEEVVSDRGGWLM